MLLNSLLFIALQLNMCIVAVDFINSTQLNSAQSLMINNTNSVFRKKF